MKNSVLVGIILTVVCGSVAVLSPMSATTPLQFTYTQTQDNSTKKYIFTLTFTGPETIYGVNVTLSQTHQTFGLKQGLQKNEFYFTLSKSLQHTPVVVSVISSRGYTQQSLTIQLGGQSKTLVPSQVINDLLAVAGLVVLLGLIAKYVLFYTGTKPKE